MNQSSELSTKYKVCIIGAGFGGIAIAIRLKQQGIDNFIILEKTEDIGGTWRENQYPGAACDVQSHMYSLSFAPKTDWSQRYAGAEEIFQYLQDVSEQFHIKPYCRFQHEVTGLNYQEKSCDWRIQLKDRPDLISQYVVFASGPLHVPQIPHIPGIENFKGQVFHSAQWNHDYALQGKKVASIGTGGSAIQYIPKIAPEVKQLYVFQRSAAWVLPRDERRYLNFEKNLFSQFNWFRKLHRNRLYWSNEFRFIPMTNTKVMHYTQKLAQAFIHLQVKDKVLAKKLTPDYTLGCKRVLISNTYFPTFNRSNVALVTDGIREIKAHSIVSQDGTEREIDCLIYGTGFITDPRIYLKPFHCVGLNGIELKMQWKDGAESYYGINTKNFPNLFQLLGPNTLLAHNSVVFIIESQVNHILQLIKAVDHAHSDGIVVRADVHDRFNTELQKQLKDSVWQSGCVSWYQNDQGKNFALWPDYTWRYWLKTKEVQIKDYHLLHQSTA